MLKTLQIFRAGRHVAASGEAIEFSAADIEASAAAYDPAKHEAPIVVGHPRHDDPAYGWVRALAARDGVLEAVPRQVEPAFAELVQRGRYKKISASFYRPDSSSNPVPGVWYLRHVGFLGAQPPAVKGLRAPSFADGEEGVVEFDEYVTLSLWRRLREWLIDQFSVEAADRVVPSFELEQLEQVREVSPPVSPAGFSEPHKEAQVNAQEIAEREAALKAEAEKLARERAELAEREQKLRAAEADARRKAIIEFVEGLVAAGKVLPRDKEPLVAFMSDLSDEGVIEFAEGDERKRLAAPDWLRLFLERLPAQVDFRERAPGALGAPTDDPEELARRAQEYIEAERAKGRSIAVSDAVARVIKGA